MKQLDDLVKKYLEEKTVGNEPKYSLNMAKLKAQEELDGTPARRETPFMMIKFQLGPVKEFGENGCQLEDLIGIALARLKGFQRGPFECEENATAILHLQGAMAALTARTGAREKRGVEGHNKA